ncbi:hypothetical protein PT2222_90188 [Paraburkholderia tropica]
MRHGEEQAWTDWDPRGGGCARRDGRHAGVAFCAASPHAASDVSPRAEPLGGRGRLAGGERRGAGRGSDGRCDGRRRDGARRAGQRRGGRRLERRMAVSAKRQRSGHAALRCRRTHSGSGCGFRRNIGTALTSSRRARRASDVTVNATHPHLEYVYNGHIHNNQGLG